MKHNEWIQIYGQLRQENEHVKILAYKLSSLNQDLSKMINHFLKCYANQNKWINIFNF